jgi:hypothetical protein
VFDRRISPDGGHVDHLYRCCDRGALRHHDRARPHDRSDDGLRHALDFGRVDDENVTSRHTPHGINRITGQGGYEPK